MKKNKKIIKFIFIIFGIALSIATALVVIYEVNDFVNDYRCGNLPVTKSVQDKTCEKYWRKKS